MSNRNKTTKPPKKTKTSSLPPSKPTKSSKPYKAPKEPRPYKASKSKNPKIQKAKNPEWNYNFKSSKFINSRLLLLMSLTIDIVLILLGAYIFFFTDVVPDELGSMPKSALYGMIVAYYFFVTILGVKLFNLKATDESFIKKSKMFGGIPNFLEFDESKQWKLNFLVFPFIIVAQIVYLIIIYSLSSFIFLGSLIIELPTSAYLSFSVGTEERYIDGGTKKDMQKKIENLENTLNFEVNKRKMAEDIVDKSFKDKIDKNLNTKLVSTDTIAPNPNPKITSNNYVVDDNFKLIDPTLELNIDMGNRAKMNQNQKLYMNTISNEEANENNRKKYYDENVSLFKKHKYEKELKKEFRKASRIKKQNDRKNKDSFDVKKIYQKNYIPPTKKIDKSN